MIGVLDMPVKRRRIELRQYKHPVDATIDTIRNRNVYQPVFTGNGYGGFAPAGCKRI
jgi:hypothetical protein